MFGVTGLRFRLLSNQASGWSARGRFCLWGVLWIAGHVLGGILIGGALGLAGSACPVSLRRAAMGGLALACVAWGLRQLGWFGFPMPQWRRQVQREWMMKHPWSLVALGYGIQLGCGVSTYIPVCTTYAAMAFALVSGSAAVGSQIMALFGLARCIVPLGAAPYVASPLRSLRFAANLDSYEPWVLRTNGVLLILTGGALLALHLPWPLMGRTP